MAESSVAQSEFTNQSSTELSIPSSLKFLMANLKNVAFVSLTSDNYPIWSSQVYKLFAANDFESFLTGEKPCPPKPLQSPTGDFVPNPDYHRWTMLDQNLAAALYSTISVSILPYVLNLDSTTAIWNTLTQRLQSTSRSRVIQLKNELHHLSLKNNFVTHYLSEVKTLVDQIAIAGSHVDAEDIIIYILNGLPSTYQSFKSAIRTRPGSLSLDELYSLLLSEEVNLATEASKDSVTSQFALFTPFSRGKPSAQRGRSSSSSRGGYRGGRPQNSSNSQATSRPYIQCQICNKPGHIAANCWHRTNLDASPPVKSSPPRAFAASSVNSTNWILDTGASSHLTSDYASLQQPEAYTGTEQVSIDDGSHIPIMHSGSGILPTPTGSGNKSPPL